ncbi:NUDIX domain-containing protein [Streptomyces sp. NBC_01506]|uniref:NUDIX domain-containing protein n=1 Tax=Streptomyces sp. NBC_01506 TaxID=2903887 RepID=UPI003863E0B3
MYFELDGSGPPRRRTGVAGFFTRHVNGQLTVLLASYDGPGCRQNSWRLPGGDIQDDEFLHEAYVREVVEKAGLPTASSPEEILVVDHVPRGVTEAEGIDVVFKGGEIPLSIETIRLTAPDAAPEPGATAYRWATPGDTDTLCPGPERDRVHSAHEAWVTGRTAYLICGERFTTRRT